MIRPTERIRKRDHVIQFTAGATVCIGATLVGIAAFLLNDARAL